jgi:large conductance mechanosensitive channel
MLCRREVRMLKAFKEFALKGNVVDLAVAVILGAAFGAIINSLVKDIIMPPIGLLFGKQDFSQLFINISGKDYAILADAKAAGAATMNYGSFLNTVVVFVIVALVLFFIVRAMMRFRKDEEAEATKECPFCVETIPERASRCPHCTSALGGAGAAT